jgi:hypothetical protein
MLLIGFFAGIYLKNRKQLRMDFILNGMQGKYTGLDLDGYLGMIGKSFFIGGQISRVDFQFSNPDLLLILLRNGVRTRGYHKHPENE